MFRPVLFLWLVAAFGWNSPVVQSSSEIESSISADSTGHLMPGSLRFYGVTKTMKTTTTVVHLYTTYVHQSCLIVDFGITECPKTTPPPPTTTTTTTTTTSTPTPVTVTTGTTSAPAPTTSTPALFEVVTGQFKPSVWTNITVNKLSPPNLNFPPLPVIGSGLSGLFNNKPPINIKVSANGTASITPGNGRRRPSEILLEKIQPSIVRQAEMTASPDLSLRESIQQDVAVEASRAEEYHQYQISGVMPHHFAERALPLLGGGNPITIVRLDPVTVTVSQTVTSKFPFAIPSDRVTLLYAGCVPSNIVGMNLPHCY